MLEYCTRKFSYPEEPRKPTALKMRIIQCLVEGTILAHHLPQFLRRCSDLDSLVRMENTILVQVEGEIVGKVSDLIPMYADHQISGTIGANIIMAARARKKQTSELMVLIYAVKAVGYNRLIRTLYFCFFTQAEAKKWKKARVPFRNQVLRLLGHQPELEPETPPYI